MVVCLYFTYLGGTGDSPPPTATDQGGGRGGEERAGRARHACCSWLSSRARAGLQPYNQRARTLITWTLYAMYWIPRGLEP